MPSPLHIKAVFAGFGFDLGFRSYSWPLPLPMFLPGSLPERLHTRKPRDARASSEPRRQGRLLQWLLSFDEDAFKRRRGRPWGASCILVATKRSVPRA